MAIKSFSHKGLKKFFYDDNSSGLVADHLEKIGMILDAIDSSHHPHDLKQLFLDKFAKKKGSGDGVFSIQVNGNFRITFQIEDDGAIFLDYGDYHGKQIKSK